MIYQWYASRGHAHVAAYLDQLDITDFDAKAPPPKTPAFWETVDTNRAPEDAELADLLDRLRRPDAVTVANLVVEAVSSGTCDWVKERRNRCTIGSRLEHCGYVAVRNDTASNGYWSIKGSRSQCTPDDAGRIYVDFCRDGLATLAQCRLKVPACRSSVISPVSLTTARVQAVRRN